MGPRFHPAWIGRKAHPTMLFIGAMAADAECFRAREVRPPVTPTGG